MSLELTPLTLRAANQVVTDWHRHSKPTTGHKFSIGCSVDGELVGVAIIGRPVARLLNDPATAEVLRLCVTPEAPKNTCSFLYSASWRAWRAMGGTRMITYILAHEPGTSLKAANWSKRADCQPGEWNRKGRSRDTQDVYKIAKERWEVSL